MNTEDLFGKIPEYNIKDYCHVDTNVDGDRFVGVKADNDKTMVYFPLGYELPKTDAEIRQDIRHLIQVLSEFTTKEDRLIKMKKFTAHQSVDFPINAYRTVIEYYLDHGYYEEKETTFKESATGKQNWARTAKKEIPLVQSNNGVSSFIYTTYQVRTSKFNDKKLITQINKYCVYEAFQKLGWLYVPYLPEQSGQCPSIKESISITKTYIANTNDDKKRALFQAMLEILSYLDDNSTDKQFYFGVDTFDGVWEKLIDKTFGVKEKDDFFPRSRWLLDYGKYHQKRPLMPDTIMIYKDKYYVIDAKCYKYGQTGKPEHLPNGASINKQITYGEYLEKYKCVDKSLIYNAFIMPFNSAKNYFDIEDVMGNIGEAVGDWRNNQLYYERIQGIVVDTRFLMYHYIGNTEKQKKKLTDYIEKVENRATISSETN